ncbi:MAG TPA: RDD family protein [Gammaproteobacteria bacterium]|nr:RDD family protein [Gammaproteobacteria bacterium]
MSERNPYAPPQTEVRDPPLIREADNLAPRRLRLIGVLVDGLANAVVFGPLLLFSGLWSSLLSDDVPFRVVVLVSLGGVAVFLLLNGYLLATAGQTIGKRVVGTRIVNVADGRIPKFLTLVGGRYGVTWLVSLIPGAGNLYGLVDALFVFRDDRRCLHDLIAGTKVITV